MEEHYNYSYQVLKDHKIGSITCWRLVTGFWKTNQNVTLATLIHFIGPANTYTCTLIATHVFTVALTGLADWSAFLE